MQFISSKFTKRILSLMLVAVMTIGIIPFQAIASTENSDSNANNVVSEVEEWVYTPSSTVEYEVEKVKSSSSDSAGDIVKVKVIAREKETDKEVNMANEYVDLYVGSEYKGSFKTDSEGVAEVSLKGLSEVERKNATVSAKAVVSRGKAIDGNDRDKLFNHFPKDAHGDYYRYTMELHSETIDKAGNWLGTKIPESKESNKVDIVFAIDATGSMSDEINNVKTNIAAFSENLMKSGLDIRFCIIEYRDMTLSGEDTIVHTSSDGSHWLTDVDSVVSVLGDIEATGGGDGPETAVDALGHVADNSLMSWRSDAYRFAFVLTDADYKTNNIYGYGSMSEVVDKLVEMEIVTSVITSSSYSSTYSDVYNRTGGIYASITSSAFNVEMMNLSDSIIKSVIRDMTLELKEARMLVNLSVCYFANDKTSKSKEYKDSVKNMLNEYAHRMAEATDGHVLIDKIILFSTSNRLAFYNTNNMASMADIRIETEVSDKGKDSKNVQIHSNAHPGGFFTDDKYTVDSDIKSAFDNLSSFDSLLMTWAKSFQRIQMSGIEGAGWNNSMIDHAYSYSTTVMHETGHYLFGFFDEYLDADGKSWNNRNGKLEKDESIYVCPYPKEYGLMDNQHFDIEMSKGGLDYSYMTEGFDEASKSLHTNHSWFYKMSCEEWLSDLLTNEDKVNDRWNELLDVTSASTQLDYGFTGKYVGVYSKAETYDREAGYSYAGVSDAKGSFIDPDAKTSKSAEVSEEMAVAESAVEPMKALPEPTYTSEKVADVKLISNDTSVTVTLTPDEGSAYKLYILNFEDEDYEEVSLTAQGDKFTAELPVAISDIAEIRIVAEKDGAEKYNTYYIVRTEKTDVGYIYASPDNSVEAYVITNTEESYTFVADNTRYTNGEYTSVNQATYITSDNGIGFEYGEIYSVASYMAEIDYTTLTWFYYADGVWTALATDISEEENKNLGARADLSGEGLYVLMAKKAPVGGIDAAQNITYTQSTEKDATVIISFDDVNDNSKYYNVYYSDEEFTDKNAENVVVKTFDASSTELQLYLIERGRTVYVAIEIVAEDGTRSALSDLVKMEAGEADSDGDGIPDWYCNKYLLWGADGEEKDIANSDDDGDGLTNLEEYIGGSDPTNPNDPEHTTNIPVDSITVSVNELTLRTGESSEVSAVILPENATNKKVNWRSQNNAVATVEVVDGVCTITAVAEGTTKVYAVTADGGYSAVINVTVIEGIPCVGYFKVDLSDGPLDMYLNGVDFGEFTFAQIGDGWTIQNTDGKYLSVISGKLALADKEFKWKYTNGTFSAMGYSTWLWIMRPVTYYLTNADGELAVSQNVRKASIVTFYTNVENDEHLFGEWIGTDGEHTHICTYCGYMESEACEYDETHKCIYCGSFDDKYVYVNISVDIEKVTSRWFFFLKKISYNVVINTDSNGVEISKVEFSTDNEHWKNGKSFNSTKEVDELYIRVTDENGNVYTWLYVDGEVNEF